MKQSETKSTHDASHHLISQQSDTHAFHNTGQLRRAKLHAAHLIESIDGNKLLPPYLHQLLEASLILETTNSKILALYLKKSPSTIRNEFLKIRSILGRYGEIQKVSNINAKSIVNEFALSE
ncbi:hypothetical protein ABF87_08835 [Nitrosomonas sp. JL21]|uniref:hypothetical protein n=1 Tax=Nitrosomonas sp. JL21 TaxID=153949 RepID=UPI00136830AB|nr:hypothetical protein [Nitrosomonas sp. JL21]MBL8498770.1 hypothetical protein [Nitrosomonas sp.]MXS78060.1 hypothetical protein [Nitrosomonas sp. JL21]